MIDNVLPEISRVIPERQANAVRLLYRPDVARKNMGKYFVDERINGIIRGKKIVDQFIDGQDLEENQKNKETKPKIERKNKSNGKIKRTTYSEVLGEEGNKEIQFVGLVRDYHDQLSKSIEQKGQLLKDHRDEFLDPLSIGILYEIHKDKIQTLKVLDFPALIESDQFKVAKKTALLALAEESLNRMDGPDLKEIDTFQRYLEKKQVTEKDLSDHELKNLFIKSLEDNPERFLQDYYVNFRFDEEATQSFDVMSENRSARQDREPINQVRNTFKLGEMVAREVVKVDKFSRSKLVNVEEFLPYEDKERKFDQDKQFWRTKIVEETRNPDVKAHLAEALHGKNETRHRSEQALLDRGILKADSD